MLIDVGTLEMERVLIEGNTDHRNEETIYEGGPLREQPPNGDKCEDEDKLNKRTDYHFIFFFFSLFLPTSRVCISLFLSFE